MNRIAWKCPVCGASLLPEYQKKPYVMRCCADHSFDIARQGYVNLLLAKKRSSASPGDSAEMVSARTAFLGGGYYRAFSDGVSAACLDLLGENGLQRAVIADAGCGEGYYTQNLCRYLGEHGIDAACVGFDLSKDAVTHASSCAKRASMADRLSYAVASIFELPLADACCDGIINLFAPVAVKEFDRVLKKDGFLLCAVPGERHLWGLKEAVYDTPYLNEVRRDVLDGFVLTEVRRIEDCVTICTQEHIRALFSMTPYYWKTAKEDTEKLSRLQTLKTEIVFDLLLYRKR
ncbi:MAG: methyltransferase domain-containing protein [Clostridia bacterium]|nr:methyltransferase domain-containing protein [Clostridia bacterium]